MDSAPAAATHSSPSGFHDHHSPQGLGRQAMPRKVWLAPEGKQLVQWPVYEVESLRGGHVNDNVTNKLVKAGGTSRWRGSRRPRRLTWRRRFQVEDVQTVRAAPTPGAASGRSGCGCSRPTTSRRRRPCSSGCSSTRGQQERRAHVQRSVRVVSGTSGATHTG
jgi:hypothetical protein